MNEFASFLDLPDQMNTYEDDLYTKNLKEITGEGEEINLENSGEEE